GRARLSVNKANYCGGVVPPMLRIRATTLELMEKFGAAGGRIVWMGRAASYVDALPSSRAARTRESGERVDRHQRAVVRALASASPVQLHLRAGTGLVLHHLRRDGDRSYLFL